VPAKPTLVILVRHGVTATTGVKLPGRARGLHLSEAGQRQAAAAAARLVRIPGVAAVYASPLERARETAAPIAQARGLTVRIEEDLADLDVGQWTGISLKQASKKPEWRIIQQHPSGFRFPGGESFTEMQTRMASAVARLVGRHEGKAVVAVSHADPIKALVAHALGTPLDLFQRVLIGPASITAIVYRAAGPMLLTVNSVDGDLAALLGR
jgi:probable phosphomutase (TIGR03848 family)